MTYAELIIKYRKEQDELLDSLDYSTEEALLYYNRLEEKIKICERTIKKLNYEEGDKNLCVQKISMS